MEALIVKLCCAVEGYDMRGVPKLFWGIKVIGVQVNSSYLCFNISDTFMSAVHPVSISYLEHLSPSSKTCEII